MPSRNILVINCGSSSIKFALVNEAHSLFPLHGLAERLGSRDAVLRWKRGGDSDSLMIPNADHRAALAQLLPMVQNAAGGKLHGIGHRVVHGGELFTHATRIDDRVVEAIRATAPLAPLHNPANLQGIEAAMTLFPKLPHVAVFDTAFHQSLPEHAYRYALPEALYREHGVRRYGFHGTSHRYVSHRAAEMAGLAVGDSSWLSAHLGNGSSTCAIVNGQSLDTSMGLTPLEGLVMGTRSGDVDPNLHSHLARTLGWSLERIDSMLNNESGLLGLSDLSNDMRTLEQGASRATPARPWRSGVLLPPGQVPGGDELRPAATGRGDLHRWHRRELAAGARQDRRPPAAVRPAPRPGGQRPLRARRRRADPGRGASAGTGDPDQRRAADRPRHAGPARLNWIDAPAQPGGVAKRTA